MQLKYWMGACALASATLLPAADVAPTVRVVEEIVAKVNGDIITRGELEKTRQVIEAELSKQGLTGLRLTQAVNEKSADALRDQIDQLLLVQRGKDLSVKVDPEVTRRIAEIQVQSKISDPDKFHEYIREGTGLSFEDFKQQMTNQLLTQRVIGQEVGSKISVPKADVEKYYNEHRAEFMRQEMVFLREILISTGDKSPAAIAAAEKKARDILAKARKGEKFNELARNYSDNTETAKNDGELGAFKKGDLRKEIEDVVFKQNKGYITEPILTDNGFEILKVEERHAPGQAALADVENEIMEKLYVPRMQPKVREYLTKLRQDAFIEIRGGFVDSGAAPGKDTSWKDPAQLKPETTTKEEVAARKKKKFLKIIPHGGGKVQATTPSGTPGSATPPPPTTAPPSSAPAASPK